MIDVESMVAEATRELRLRMRIDALLDRCARKERRIVQLEAALRDLDRPTDERILLLESRVKHWERRFLDVSEQLLEARSAA